MEEEEEEAASSPSSSLAAVAAAVTAVAGRSSSTSSQHLRPPSPPPPTRLHLLLLLPCIYGPLQGNEKCLKQRKCNQDTNESSGNELQKNYQKDEPKQSRTASEGQAYPKIATITPQRCSKSTQQNPKPITSRLDYGRDVTSQKSENSLRKTKSSSQHEQFISPKGVASTKKAMACGKQLTVIKEISSTASRSEEAAEPSHNDISHANKAATSSASRSVSQGKRPLTIHISEFKT
ncbi:unnamed protein product [Camellia sinensis]